MADMAVKDRYRITRLTDQFSLNFLGDKSFKKAKPFVDRFVGRRVGSGVGRPRLSMRETRSSAACCIFLTRFFAPKDGAIISKGFIVEAESDGPSCSAPINQSTATQSLATCVFLQGILPVRSFSLSLCYSASSQTLQMANLKGNRSIQQVSGQVGMLRWVLVSPFVTVIVPTDRVWNVSLFRTQMTLTRWVCRPNEHSPGLGCVPLSDSNDPDSRSAKRTLNVR